MSEKSIAMAQYLETELFCAASNLEHGIRFAQQLGDHKLVAQMQDLHHRTHATLMELRIKLERK
jgi:hypothetical protein